MKFALAVGWRKSNILELEWSQVDLLKESARIHADQTKAGEALGTPLNKKALEILERQSGRHLKRVFTYRGKPIKEVNTKAWRKAIAAVGLKVFRWHDLRHTWASWHVQRGTPCMCLRN